MIQKPFGSRAYRESPLSDLIPWLRVDSFAIVNSNFEEVIVLTPRTIIGVGHPSYQHKVLWDGIVYTVPVSTNSSVTNFAFDDSAKTESFEIVGADGTRSFATSPSR